MRWPTCVAHGVDIPELAPFGAAAAPEFGRHKDRWDRDVAELRLEIAAPRAELASLNESGGRLTKTS